MGDFPAMLAAEFRSQAIKAKQSIPALGIAMDDAKSAYKQCPARTPPVIATWSERDGSVRYHFSWAMPFGSLHRRFRSSRPNCSWLFRASPAKKLKLHTKPTKCKRKRLAQSQEVLSTIVSLEHFRDKAKVMISPKPSRCQNVLETMKQAKFNGPKGRLPSGIASSLAGKLSFMSSSSFFGGIGRAPCAPLVRRANPDSLLGQDVDVTTTRFAGREGSVWAVRKPDDGRKTVVVRWTDDLTQTAFATLPAEEVQTTERWTPALDSTLNFFSTIFRPDVLPSRVIDVSDTHSPPIVLLCDASSESGIDEIGIVFHDTSTPHIAGVESSLILPEWLSNKIRPQQHSSAICPAELIAGVVALLTFRDECRGRRILLWTDNTAAFSGMVNGFSSSKAMQQASNLFHLTRAALQTDMWIEWVASDANISDIPSRNRGVGHTDEEAYRKLGLTSKPANCFSEKEWDDPLLLFDRLC